METCCWCTPVNSVADTLKSYACFTLPTDQFAAANDDLCYCLECVDEYHKAKDELPFLHEILWKHETDRLIAHFEKSIPEEEDDDVIILEKDEERKVHCLESDFEKNLRVPLLEILKYPYLLLHKDLSQLFVKAICKMEVINYPCQVLGKHPGVYLLMVHPNETIRRWAILTAKSLGKVDRDDYYDIQEVLTCLLKVIELNLFENAYVFSPLTPEKGNLILLPDHLYDVTSYKNYWLGICMVLMVLDEQAMDSLLLGPEKQDDFMQCIIKALKTDMDDESNSPFWPALHCFMVILDKLGSKVWGQHIDPTEAFLIINNSKSYNKEIENIRQSCKRTVPPSDCEDEMVTCSQLVYDYQLEKPQKVTKQKNANCPNYFPDLYEDMRTLIDAFQADFGQDIRLHNSTFLWLIPFTHSLMDLKELGVAYIVQVMNHLCLKTNVSKNSAESYDKVSQFFIWVLVIVIQLHLKKKFMSSLWVSAEKWVPTVVAWAKLPSAVFMPGIEGRAARNCLRSTATSPSLETESVQSFCMKLIRNILKEGLYDMNIPLCKPYFLKFNVLLRNCMDWELNTHQTKELQYILKHIICNMWAKSGSPSSATESPPTCVTSTQEDMCPVNEGSVSANRDIKVQRNMSCDQTLGAQNKGDFDQGLEEARLFSPSIIVSNDSSESTILEPETEEAQSVRDQRKSQEGLKSDIVAGSSGNTSAPLISKLEAGSSNTFLGLLGDKRNKGKDGLMEFRTGQQESEKSSSDDEMAKIPLDIIMKNQRKKFAAAATATAAATSTATDSRIDKVLSKDTFIAYTEEISLPIDSRQETSMKVIGSVQSQSASEDNLPSKVANEATQTIIISDSSSEDENQTSSDEDENQTSSDEDENQVNTSRESRKEKTHVRHEKRSSAPWQEPMNTSLTNEEHESQLFEFETQDDIYSEWQDSQMDEELIEDESLLVETDNGFTDFDLEMNNWGYESNPHWSNGSEEAKKEKVQNSKTETKPHTLAEKVNTSSSTSTGAGAGCSRHMDPSAPTGPSRSAPAVKESTIQPGHAPPQAEPARSTPAVVPPAKVHYFPPPTSLTEELGLSKKVRRAAELSQRTQDSLAELRRHGEIAGRVNVAQKKTTQLINPTKLTTKNKKMLSCQELQFYRQTRPKEKEKNQHTRGGNLEAQTSEEAMERDPRRVQFVDMAGMGNKKKNSDSLRNSTTGRKLVSQERGVQPTPVSPQNKFTLRQEITSSDTNVQERTPGSSFIEATASKTNPLTSPDTSSSSSGEDVALKEGELQLNENIEDNNLFLTQMDPEDMELCSQIESSSNPTDMEIAESANPLQAGNEICKETGSKRVAEAGAPGASHSAGGPQDNASAKIFAPPRLSTVKIFSNSSRTANLTKELESPQAVPKGISNPFKLPTWKGIKWQSKISKPNIILQPQNSNNVPQLQNVRNSSNNVYNGGLLPASRAVSWHEMNPRFTQANSVNVQQRNPAIFIKEVLKWNYDMFAQFDQFGPPSHLLQSIVAAVPAAFKDYNDYFNIFFPLMMLNTFETVAHDWIENQKSKEKRLFDLILLNFNLDTNEADFTVNISGSNLEKEHYPKVDDFVVLTVSEKQAFERESPPVYHIGCVTRFSSKNREQNAVHLSVKTQGNLSCIDKRVMCLTIGSMVTMQRMFKALLLLNRSPLAKAIISPEYTDFSLIRSNVDSENSSSFMREFNEDQRTAIETAYALVSESPWLPKVCLIHGPPGSGKSKTILGLLYCIFNQRPGKENYVQSKIKKNRVLLCAPSNAAVDELMKKIILMFKEKCQDKSNPLGNCGDINLVRLGQERSICKDVWKFSLDALADREMNRTALGNDQDIHKQKEELDRQLDVLSRQRAIAKTKSIEQMRELEQEICRLGNERKKLTVQLKKDCGRSQEDMKANIILKSHIICCTLSTSGSAILVSAFRRQGCDPLSCVIVDEAAQSCEIETLIPLTHGCKKLVLVGDPKQLPPTVKSMKAEEYGYGQSLIERLCRHLNGQFQEKLIDRLPVLRLTTQYRMHPEICLFPSNYVYKRALKTDRRTEKNRFSMDWPFLPYLLFDVLDAQEIRESDSFINFQEVKLVIELMKLITKKKAGINFHDIGIITPYSAQKRRILSELEKEFGENEKSIAEVDTVDAFQGREKDCIIVTCVRAKSTQGSIGFLKSLQRLNVTLTRAKFSLFIVGHLQTLMENKYWNALIQDAKKRGSIIKTSNTRYNTSSYASSAKMILKPMSTQEWQAKARIGQVATSGEVPAQHPQPSSSGAPAPGNRGTNLVPAFADSGSSNPQTTTSQNRPRDPRLAKWAEEGMRKHPTESDSPTAPKRQRTTE